MARSELSDRDQGCSPGEPARTRLSQQGLNVPKRLLVPGAALATALLALACYCATLLPGLDLGDSASFQTGVGSLTLTPRQAYPLYYALGNVFMWLDPREPAHALNLASAVYGALAVGAATWLTAWLAASALAGIAGGLFLAFSYTFWTQSITAEVYTLHLLIVGAVLMSLLWWSEQPTPRRLALFYALYAFGFGNHLSMILLLPALAVFLLMHRPAGAADPLHPKMILLATAIAAAAALQYAWNFAGLWSEADPPSTVFDAVGRFWFDVTKSDWRESIVMGVSDAGLQNRPAMYGFDLRQQFGLPGVALAAAGFTYLVMRWPARGVLLLLLYLVNLGFAWTYNVGDAYIFFLPSHYVMALCAGAGIAAIVWLLSRVSTHAVAAALGAACLAYPMWRGYDQFPAADRSWDDRPTRLLGPFASARDAILGVDGNWQVQNAVEYYMRRHQPFDPWFLSDELPITHGRVTERLQPLIEANQQIGRRVLVSDRFLQNMRLFGYRGGAGEVRHSADPGPWQRTLAAEIEGIVPGTPYALGILRADREYPFDVEGFSAAWSALAGSTSGLPPLRDYTIVLGRVGEPPLVVDARDRPYRLRTFMDGAAFDIRMESWLPADTIRRAGFGHVIVNRAPVLILERGISFVAFGPAFEPLFSTYRSSIFAPIPRFVLDPPARP